MDIIIISLIDSPVKIQIIPPITKKIIVKRIPIRSPVLISICRLFNRELFSKLEAINPRVDRLSDVTHGLGTTLVGIFIAFIIWIVLFLKFESSFLLPFSIGFVLIILNFSNYVYSLKMYQNLLNTTFASILNEDLNQISKKDSNNNMIVITLIK